MIIAALLFVQNTASFINDGLVARRLQDEPESFLMRLAPATLRLLQTAWSKCRFFRRRWG
jgi:hypothetical protein